MKYALWGMSTIGKMFIYFSRKNNFNTQILYFAKAWIFDCPIATLALYLSEIIFGIKIDLVFLSIIILKCNQNSDDRELLSFAPAAVKLFNILATVKAKLNSSLSSKFFIHFNFKVFCPSQPYLNILTSLFSPIF